MKELEVRNLYCVMKYYVCDRVKQKEIGEECGMSGGEGFGGRT